MESKEEEEVRPTGYEARVVQEVGSGGVGHARLGGYYRGTSLIRNRHPPEDHPTALGIGLLYGPREGRFLMSKVPL